MKMIISGGGTGGHIYPALAIADELKRKNSQVDILYIGKKGSLEEELSRNFGYAFKTIHVEGLPRKKLSIKTIKSGITLLRGIFESKKIIKDFQPDVVVGTGGYVCGPIVWGAQHLGIPTLVQEQNAYPGKTNRLLAKHATKVALSFEEAQEYLSRKDNIIITGNPIRREIYESVVDKRKEESTPHVLSFGGSGGQESTNEAVLEILKEELVDFKWTHITGKDHYEDFTNKLKGVALPKNVSVLSYSHEIPKLLDQVDLVIASSSAMTLAEISAKKLPSILIPKAYTAGNHQVYNARFYEKKGASIILYEDSLNGEKLYQAIIELLQNKEIRREMGKIAGTLGNPKAVEIIVDIILSLKRENRGGDLQDEG